MRRAPAVLTLAILLAAAPAFAADATQPSAVTVTQDAASFTMSNGVITAKVNKRNGDLSSLMYNGVETLTNQSGHAGAYWSHDASGGVETITAVTIDPATNSGDRAEVSVKGISGGKKMGHPAGGAADGDFPADIEIRYSLGKTDSGVYSYCILTHKPEYPAGSIGEARFCAKLASMYDWLSVDPNRNKYYPREEPGEDKYVYTAVQSQNLAYGWSSTTQKTGWYIVNPTIEYLSGGPTKVEFLCHRDTTAVQAPCTLNYWRSSHYGGAALYVAQGESFTKVIGPFFMYVNTGPDPMAMWHDALDQAKKESAKWPYDWISGVDYPHKDQRSTVSGKFHINDPLAPANAMSAKSHYTVGLCAASYQIPAGGPAGGPAGAAARMREITWQTDAKHYEFWTSADGTPEGAAFSLPNVRPGNYTLYAYAEGVLGEFQKADITIPEGGKPVDLGTIDWTPVRRGRQLWQIGTPNRTATEFAGGDKYFASDTQIQYAVKFPNDVTFTVGQSDPAKDWYYEHIPHNIDPEATIVPFSGVRSKPGKATPYTIRFDLADAPAAGAKATLRLAFCSASVNHLDVAVNDKAAGTVDRLNSTGDSTIVRHNIQGIWFERELPIDGTLLQKGANTLTLTIPEGTLNSGVIYDTLRLELDENLNAKR